MGISSRRTSSLGAWRDRARVICSPSSASLYIWGTSPQVETVMFLWLMFSPSGALRSLMKRTTFS